MIRRAVLLSAILFSSLVQASFIFVGNSGEGILTANGVFTRDLYEYDIHEHAWGGRHPDQQLRGLLKGWNPLELSDSQLESLVSKLTDIEASLPGVGVSLVHAIKYFHWEKTDEHLNLIVSDEGRRPVEISQRVAIANRYLNSIQVQRSYFAQLDDANKVALILHEAVYALVKPKAGPVRGKTFFQSISLTRLVTSGFFDQKRLGSASFADIVYGNLAVEDLRDEESDLAILLKAAPEYAYLLSAYENGIQRPGFQLKETLSGVKLEPSISKYCAFLFKQARQYKVLTLSKRPRGQVQITSFLNQQRSLQYALKVKFIEDKQVFSDVESEDTCVTVLGVGSL